MWTRRLLVNDLRRCGEAGRRLLSHNHRQGAPSAASSSPALLSSLDEGVLTLTLNRPSQRNAMNLELLELLQQEIDGIQNNSNVGVVVVASEGNIFCAGYDWQELIDSSPQQQAHILRQSTRLFQSLRGSSQPTISAVQGVATGAGCALAVACDLVVASPMSAFGATASATATTGLSSLSLPNHATSLVLGRLVGEKKALDMILTRRLVPAKQALEWGLVSHVLGSPQRHTQQLAREVLTASSIHATTKQGYFELFADNEKRDEEAFERANKRMVDFMQSTTGQTAIRDYIQAIENEPLPSVSKRHDKFKQFSEIPSGAEMRHFANGGFTQPTP